MNRVRAPQSDPDSSVESKRQRRKLLMMSSTETRNKTDGERVTSNANDIVFAHDLAGHITFLNQAGERISGYSCHEACQMNIAELVAPEFAEQVRKHLARTVRKIPGAVFEIDIIAKDGRRVALEVSTRVAFADGSRTGIEGIAVPSVLRSQDLPNPGPRCVDEAFVFGSFSKSSFPTSLA